MSKSLRRCILGIFLLNVVLSHVENNDAAAQQSILGANPDVDQFFQSSQFEKLPSQPLFAAQRNSAIQQHAFQGQPYSNVPAGVMVRQPYIEALFLGRSGLTGGAFVFDDNGPSFSFEDLALDLDTGFRAGLGIYTSDESGLDLTFMRQDNSRVDIVDGPNVVPVFFNGIPANPEPSYDIVYDSSINSYEANYWLRQNPNWRVGCGMRVYDMEEDFNVLVSSNPTTGFRSDTTNVLIGAQLLVEHVKSISDGWNLILGGKFGGFNNNSDVHAVSLNEEFTRETDVFSFAMDYKAGLQYEFTEITTFEIGYQGLFFTNVATGPAQSQVLSFFAPNTNQIAFDTVNYNGIYFGAAITY